MILISRNNSRLNVQRFRRPAASGFDTALVKSREPIPVEDIFPPMQVTQVRIIRSDQVLLSLSGAKQQILFIRHVGHDPTLFHVIHVILASRLGRYVLGPRSGLRFNAQ